MNTNEKAQKILKGLKFDFATFTMDAFLQRVKEVKGREIITIPWEMPLTLFGAWISDANEAREYIFYRNNVPEAHQIHIQLHELSHFLFGHKTFHINREVITEVVAGKASLPFADLPQLRSPRLADLEAEAETLASLIQEQAIRNSKLDLLIHDAAPEEKLTNFLKKMGSS
jgi:hypothetical protein